MSFQQNLTNHPPRLLLAEPLPAFRLGVRLVLLSAGYEIVEAADLAELSTSVAAAPPDLVLVDRDLPPSGALAAIRHVREACGAPTIVWTVDPDGAAVLAAIRAGAAGFVHKEISSSGLLRALRGVADGEAPLARDLTSLLVNSLQGSQRRERARERAAALSGREREVLSLVAGGARNKQVARRLVISEFTVKRHVQNILQKLDLPSRWEAAAFYRSLAEQPELEGSL